MKLKEVIEKIDKSKKNEDSVSIYELGQEVFDLFDLDWIEQERLKCYWIYKWYCTDSYVGQRAYFFDDKLVAVSYQSGRKCSEEFRWVSNKIFKEVYEYIKSFQQEQALNTPDFLDLEEECGETYKISFYSQLFDYQKNEAIYKGKPVKIVNFRDSYNDKENGMKYYPEIVEIIFEDKETTWVETKELDFPLIPKSL